MVRSKPKKNPWIKPRQQYSEEGILEAVKQGLESYPLWLASEYPKKFVISTRHGLTSLVMHMSTGRTFDIKIKERKKRGSHTTDTP